MPPVMECSASFPLDARTYRQRLRTDSVDTSSDEFAFRA
jgi:hypothetical protein